MGQEDRVIDVKVKVSSAVQLVHGCHVNERHWESRLRSIGEGGGRGLRKVSGLETHCAESAVHRS